MNTMYEIFVDLHQLEQTWDKTDKLLAQDGDAYQKTTSFHSALAIILGITSNGKIRSIPLLSL